MFGSIPSALVAAAIAISTEGIFLRMKRAPKSCGNETFEEVANSKILKVSSDQKISPLKRASHKLPVWLRLCWPRQYDSRRRSPRDKLVVWDVHACPKEVRRFPNSRRWTRDLTQRTNHFLVDRPN